jgi:hypothetical protein
MAKATLDPNPKVPWDSWADDNSRIRVSIGETYPDAFADIVIVACGALSSTLLLMRSVSDAHPNWLANGSGQVGRD